MSVLFTVAMLLRVAVTRERGRGHLHYLYGLLPEVFYCLLRRNSLVFFYSKEHSQTIYPHETLINTRIWRSDVGEESVLSATTITEDKSEL